MESLRAAELFVASGDLVTANLVCQSLMAARGTTPEALVQVGKLFERMADVAWAKNAYSKAITADPQFALAQSSLGLLFLRERELEEAYLLYPSGLIPVGERPTEDRLETILALADQRQMHVYLGSLQTYEDWSAGVEFVALREWNKRVAQDVLARYGHHPSLEGWYFTQELWMNWVKYYTAQSGQYYGTTLLKDFVADMKVIDLTKPVAAAVVFKKTLGSNTDLWLTPSQLQATTQAFLQTTKLHILMPQDGAGAEEGAPPVAELPAYFQAFKAAADSAATGAALWSTVETFTQVPGLTNAQFPPGSSLRLQQQVNNVRPYVSGLVSWIYGNDMSEQATYYPVQASSLDRKYRFRFRPAVTPRWDAHLLSGYNYSIAPDPNRADPGNTKLSNRAGGGFDGYLLTDWAGHQDGSSGGTVRVTADLGAVKQISQVRALSLLKEVRDRLKRAKADAVDRLRKSQPHGISGQGPNK